MIRPKLFAFVLLLASISCGEKPSLPTSTGRWVAGPETGKLDLLTVDLIDGQTGWAAGDIDPGGAGGFIYATTDGGLSWKPAGQTPGVIASICFVNKSRGWIAGYEGRIERTDDGGRSWKNQRVEREGELLNSIFFIDNERGWIAGEDGLILATTDGGASWQEQATGTDSVLYGLAVAPGGAVVAVGASGTILRSEDGKSWGAVASTTTESLNSVAAGSKDMFWAVGTNGATLSSADGGSTWTAHQAVAARELLAVDLAGPARGVAVGRRGAVQALQE